MYQNTGGVLCSEDKDAVCTTRIGVAAVNVIGRDGLTVLWELTNGWMGQQEDRMGLAIGPAEQLDNLGPEAPRHIVDGVWFRKKSHHNVFCNRMFHYIGLNFTLLVGSVELLLGQNFIKLRRLRTFAFQNGQVLGIHCSQKPVCFVPCGSITDGLVNGL